MLIRKLQEYNIEIKELTEENRELKKVEFLERKNYIVIFDLNKHRS